MSETILLGHEAMEVSVVGGKAASLYELRELPVPEWLVLTTAAFYASKCDVENPTVWQVSAEIRSELMRLLSTFSGENDFFAVRSSAVDEDGKGYSFAGQFESFLGISLENVPDAVVKVWRSAYSERIRAYRDEHNLGECVPPAVIVQKMVAAESAGVCFSVDPIQGRWNVSLVSSVWGLGSTLVDGELDGDTWHVGRNGSILEKQVGKKIFGIYLQKGQTVKIEHDQEKSAQPSLDDASVAHVAALSRLCAQKRGTPQDIEWGYEKGVLYLLQSRPITSLGRVADPDGKVNIWDNSNIAESYGGVTTPLTYSFARSIYEEVYRQFCKIMGVPRYIIEANNETYRGLLGLMNGRMYYNLINWYRLLACFPGFTVNRNFMEQMMGVQKELGDELLTCIHHQKTSKIMSYYHLTRATAGMAISLLRIRKNIEKFYLRLNNALADPEIPFSEQRADELVVSYRELERKLLLKWDAPLINDFFAMIFFGVLSKLCKSWCGDSNGTLQNDLVGGSGRVISAEPAKRVIELAELIKNDQKTVSLFQSGSLSEIFNYIQNHKKMARLYQDYLDDFGDRCIDELKLESITLHENPLPFLRAIGHFAGHERKHVGNQAIDARLEAEKRVLEKLDGKGAGMRKFFFRFILNRARSHVEDRENLRFERTRLFGRVRRIMVELGKRFSALNIIDEYSDIFYLEKDEILSFVEGFCSCPDLRGVVKARKRHFQVYRTLPPIADRFQTRGMVFVGNDFSIPDSDVQMNEQQEGIRHGIGCCPGVVRGKACVVRDPRGAELPAGSILVAERTDPGWIMLFPAAAGLLVEKGSLLSHSAIVARELGLPAIVSIQGVTSWLKDGDEIEFDGSTGVVRLLDRKRDDE
jgi:phosphohistidine swiveling domain-containing protein